MTAYDARRIHLLVGFYEYGNALTNFVELLKTASPEELAAMDSIVAEKNEFAVFTNLSKRHERYLTSLSERPKYKNEIDEGNKGLAWVIALARVEYGAMLASFSDIKSPFSYVPLHAFDREAYQTLLLDGARTHYWTLAIDKDLEKVMKTNPENQIVLAYSRRLLIARNMLAAAMWLSQSQSTEVQRKESENWQERLDGIQAVLTLNIRQYMQSVTQIRTRTSRTRDDYVNACGAMLRAERRELASGTATVETIR